MMTGKLSILPPSPVHCCMPWHARWMEGEVYGAMCCFCDRSIAAPGWTKGKHVACIYCGLDRGLIPAIDVPIGESADEPAAHKRSRAK